ncbi:hypothetical protein NKJ86_10340 [Mesorhizobium sp. M0025]|uniref:hypothetical protein n=1 Tax=Mesorhizobium sp. M0025 TaxID=2956846 RepID=UPI00333725D7
MAKTKKNRDIHPPELVRQFFARSDYLDTMVLRPLSHITMNWEASWDGETYSPEAGSFAGDLNEIIEQIAVSARPDRYHDNEDKLAERVIAELRWPIPEKRWLLGGCGLSVNPGTGRIQ